VAISAGPLGQSVGSGRPGLALPQAIPANARVANRIMIALVEAKRNEEPKMLIKTLCVKDANPMFNRYNCERNGSGLRDRFERGEPRQPWAYFSRPKYPDTDDKYTGKRLKDYFLLPLGCRRL
jgi:hypothetical protein